VKAPCRLCLIVCLILITVVPPAPAQTKLGVMIKEHYGLRLATCYACHVKDEEKDKLGEFGIVVGKLLVGKDITKRLEQVKDLEDDDENKQKVYGEVETEFAEALKKLDVLIAPNGKTYAEAIQGGEIDGLKPPK